MRQKHKDEIRYSAFISYSNKNNSTADDWTSWLKDKLKHYTIPKKALSETLNADIVKNGQLFPVCVDKSNMVPGSDISIEIQNKLRASHSLIVLCSPDSVESEWVNKEIEFFRKIRPENPVIPLVVTGYSSQEVGENPFCFPPELLKSAEPLALDLRLKVSGEIKTESFVEFDSAFAYYKRATGFGNEQTRIDCEKYENQKLLNLHKIVAAILQVDPELLVQEYLPEKARMLNAAVNNAIPQVSPEQLETYQLRNNWIRNVAIILFVFTILLSFVLFQISEIERPSVCVSLEKFPNSAERRAVLQAREELAAEVRFDIESEEQLRLDNSKSQEDDHRLYIENRIKEIVENSRIVKKGREELHGELHFCVTMVQKQSVFGW